jgi:hypothetical protein
VLSLVCVLPLICAHEDVVVCTPVPPLFFGGGPPLVCPFFFSFLFFFFLGGGGGGLPPPFFLCVGGFRVIHFVLGFGGIHVLNHATRLLTVTSRSVWLDGRSRVLTALTCRWRGCE